MVGATNQQVLDDLRKLKAELARRYDLSHFILFGSRARGQELLTSDVDLIVVSDDFRSIKFRRRPELVLQYWSDTVDLEVICYTSEEFEALKGRIGIVRHAAAEGMEV